MLLNKKTRRILVFIFSMMALLLGSCQEEKRGIVDVYPYPENMSASKDAKVFVNDQEVFVYDTRVNHQRIFSWDIPETTNPVALFDFEGKVNVEITYPYDITSAIIRPLNKNINYTFNQRTIRFELNTPLTYVIEVNGDIESAVHLITRSIETDTLDEDPQVDQILYYGPGVHNIGTVSLESNQTVYLSKGAWIQGKFIGIDVSHVRILGRGIISGVSYQRTPTSAYVPIEFQLSDHITIEGITILDPAGWAIHSYFNENLYIHDIAIITARQNGDGISLQSNKHVLVEHSFIRSWDDSLVVKNYDLGNSEDIVFRNISIWTDLAQSLEIGYETYGSYIKDVTFENITIFHSLHKAAISIHNGDQSRISDITYKNIIIEHLAPIGDHHQSTLDDIFIELSIVESSIWSTSSIRGHISNIIFENITVLEGYPHAKINILGYNASHLINDVTLDVLYNESRITYNSHHLFINTYTTNIQVMDE